MLVSVEIKEGKTTKQKQSPEVYGLFSTLCATVFVQDAANQVDARAETGGHVVVPAGHVLPARRPGHLDGGLLYLRLRHSGAAQTRGPFRALHQVP